MTVELVRRADGTLAAIDVCELPPATRDLMLSNGDRRAGRVPVLTLAQYTGELVKEAEDVRAWVRNREAAKLRDVLGLALMRYNVRKAARAAERGNRG